VLGGDPGDAEADLSPGNVMTADRTDRREGDLRHAIRRAVSVASGDGMSTSTVIGIIEQELAALRRRLPAGRRRSRRGDDWQRFSDRIASRVAARYGESL
jgi:hypothetical protein